MKINYQFLRQFCCIILITVSVAACKKDNKIVISAWYGDYQVFGCQGNTQKFINVLGNIDSPMPLKELLFSVNSGEKQRFIIGPDFHRLARKGDYNIELSRDLLSMGENRLIINAVDSLGNKVEKEITIEYITGNKWPLPYTFDWDTVTNIQHVVQVLDGKWELTKQGARIIEPYYDRTLAFGDAGWENYEVKAEVTFHGFAKPEKGPPTYNVVHAALAMHWPGFDFDEYTPHRKWYPLGATCEFRLKPGLDSCSFRILGGGKVKNDKPSLYHPIILEKKYFMKTQVLRIDSVGFVYRARLWQSEQPEPTLWDIELVKNQTEIQSGCALAIAHHTEVTFGRIEVKPVEDILNKTEFAKQINEK